MKVTYLGTTMLLFDDGIDQILFDCHLTRPSILTCLLGKLETNIETANTIIDQFSINRLKAIFISHSHHDHVLDAPYFANRTNASIYGSESTLNVARGGNVKEEQLHLFKVNTTYEIGEYKITILPSIHSIAHWYNNDLGQVITTPVKQPARKKQYKEGGSFDFYIEHSNKKYIIRPSYNYLPHQLDDYTCDILFLGVGGMSKDTIQRKKEFFEETIEKVQPSTVIPVHWDHFFDSIFNEPKANIGILGNNQQGLDDVKKYCEDHHITFIQQLPLTTIEL